MAASLALAGRPAMRAERSRSVRPSALSPEAIIRQRNADWLVDFEEGRPDPITGQRVPRSYAMIAVLYGVDESTVRYGIKAARAQREAADNAF